MALKRRNDSPTTQAANREGVPIAVVLVEKHFNVDRERDAPGATVRAVGIEYFHGRTPCGTGGWTGHGAFLMRRLENIRAAAFMRTPGAPPSMRTAGAPKLGGI